MRYIFILTTVVISMLSVGCLPKETAETIFARVENGRFVLPGDSPAYYVGTNFWYGAVLGSQGEGGDRERLSRELDLMQSIGVNNLRVLVGSEGDPVHSKVLPILQPEPGVYNDEVLDGLDWFMAELGKRGMFAVLFLGNSWEWSGGYSQYLEWAGRGKYPIPGVDGWDAFQEYVSGYHAVGDDDPAKSLFEDHIRFIVSRTNRYTGKPYTADPAIFSWQIANEPRAFTESNKEEFAHWIQRIARLIKSLDPNHMVSTGSEGEVGSERDLALWERIHAYPEIDYANIHIWPLNWRWVEREALAENIEVAMDNARQYIDLHVRAMEKHRKPVVLEEFGFPRDGFVFEPGTPTTLRDRFYARIFEIQTRSASEGGLFAGSNFWAWGGYGKPSGENTFWVKGDDYLGDPAQEEQGLNSVFAGDTTVALIADTNHNLATVDAVVNTPAGSDSPVAVLSLMKKTADSGNVIFGQQDFPFYGFLWEGDPDRSDVKDITGDDPALLGLDLGEIELGGEANLDGVPFTRMREEAVKQYRRGGLVTVSWHPRNPLTGGDAWDVSSDKVVEAVLPGGSEHTKFIGWLDTVAEFIASLKDGDTTIPVIFRPWHEHTGSWFWWGRDLCTTEQYTALWRMTIDRFREKNVNNFITAYSPTPAGSADNYLERWPGDRYVDLLGIDAYHGGGERTAARFGENLSENLEMMQSVARAKGKPLAVTETGSEALPMAEWWTGVLMPAIEGHDVSYVLVWRNANHTKKDNHFYAPYPGQGSETDFRKFYELPSTLFARDVAEL